MTRSLVQFVVDTISRIAQGVLGVGDTGSEVGMTRYEGFLVEVEEAQREGCAEERRDSVAEDHCVREGG